VVLLCKDGSVKVSTTIVVLGHVFLRGFTGCMMLSHACAGLERHAICYFTCAWWYDGGYQHNRHPCKLLLAGQAWLPHNEGDDIIACGCIYCSSPVPCLHCCR
jgi:hypothetical protein